MTPDQKADFKTLYETMVENIFIQKFDEYKGAALQITGSYATGKSLTAVTSTLNRPGKPSSKVEWLVANGNTIVDVRLEGLSIFRAHRDDFRNHLNSLGGDIIRFLAELRNKLGF